MTWLTKYQGGFTLIEMVMSIVIISIAAVALLNAVMNNGRALRLTERIQIGAAVVNECGEYIAASRRSGANTYAQINSTVCNFLTLPAGFTRTVALSALTTAACPPGATCQTVTISAYDNGALASRGVMMITNY